MDNAHCEMPASQEARPEMQKAAEAGLGEMIQKQLSG